MHEESHKEKQLCVRCKDKMVAETLTKEDGKGKATLG